MTEPAHLTSTRHAYDAIAEDYATTFADGLDDSPLDRAVLRAFAELVRRGHPSPDTLEVGSGPGLITNLLRGHGLAVRGVDLSPAMVQVARRGFPAIGFEVGDMHALDAGDGSLAAVVAWYSLIHVRAPDRARVVAEFRRVLRPGGLLLLGFQVGHDTLHLDEAFGHRVSLDFDRLDPDEVVAALEAAGFEIVARLVRAPEPSQSLSAPIPQGSIIARAAAPGPA